MPDNENDPVPDPSTTDVPTQEEIDDAFAWFLANVKIEAYGTVTNPPVAADEGTDAR